MIVTSHKVRVPSHSPAREFLFPNRSGTRQSVVEITFCECTNCAIIVLCRYPRRNFYIFMVPLKCLVRINCKETLRMNCQSGIKSGSVVKVYRCLCPYRGAPSPAARRRRRGITCGTSINFEHRSLDLRRYLFEFTITEDVRCLPLP